MASTGMLHRGRNTGPDGGDEVQRSLELLDSVLSEFEEVVEGGTGVDTVSGVVGSVGEVGGDKSEAAGTPDDDSPSLGGHQSEDDGYMSMNGRRTKFALSFRPTEEKVEPGGGVIEGVVTEKASSPLNISEDSVTSFPENVVIEKPPLSPPPPAEAERIISTLLPKVSPSNSSKRSLTDKSPPLLSPTSPVNNANFVGKATNNSTQTTFPKTRHQRPYGWDKGSPCKINPPQSNHQDNSQCRFSSLQFGAHHHQQPLGSSSSWLPPRKTSDDGLKKTSPNKNPTFAQMKKPFYPLQTSFGYEPNFVFGDMPYNEHPVTIYPGAKVPYKSHSPNSLSKSSSSGESKKSSNKDAKSDGETMSPKTKLPPRTLAGSIEKHHEVCRGPSENINSLKKNMNRDPSDEDRFSDDSLEEAFPPPPPANTSPSKRSSIAWEVPLDDDPLLTPGSTKVIGRRRRKSGDNSNSSTGSIPQRLEEWMNEGQNDYWPPPPVNCSTEDEVASPFSDTESEHIPLPEDIADVHGTGTYVIRRGKKDRKNIPEFSKKSSKSVKNHQSFVVPLNKSFEGEHSVEESSPSVSAISITESHNSVSSLNSRLSSDLSIPHTRFNNADFNSKFSRELTTPNSRYSVDLCVPSSNHIGKELTSPKSRLSLDLNNVSSDKHLPRDIFKEHRNRASLDKCDGILYYGKPAPNKLSPQNRFTDFKKYSCTFDNIQSLMKEGVQSSSNDPQFEESVSDLNIVPPSVVRVVSLPTLSSEPETPLPRQVLTTTVEEEEDFETPSQSSEDTSPLKKIENNISALLNQGREQHFSPSYMNKDWDIHKDEYSDDNSHVMNNVSYHSNDRRKPNDIQKSSSHNEIPSSRKFFDFHRDKGSSNKRSGIHKSVSSKDVPVSFNRQISSDSTSSSGDFPVHVQIVEHPLKLKHDFGPLPKSPGSPQFPPLPPSPVQEDDEYSEILLSLENAHIKKSKADTLPTTSSEIYHRSMVPPVVPPHGEPGTNSLKTRSMDTSFSKNRKNSSSSRTMSADRRTLPSDMAVVSGRRRTLQRQRGGRDDESQRLGVAGLQTSASLPETPVFGRGCDLPRTPHRRTTDSGPRQSNTMTSLQSMGGSSVGTYGRGNSNTNSMERALAGAELLRLAGGPARGWYPRQRHRPASIEHLERLPMSASTSNHGQWDSSRKPLTLPPNLTPKFFHKSPREALRRVTSLLIRKGNNPKESKKEKQAVSPATRSANGEESGQKQRKGFFKNFWKRSRHYSLEHP